MEMGGVFDEKGRFPTEHVKGHKNDLSDWSQISPSQIKRETVLFREPQF